MKYRHSICWIRRDLRLTDHIALGAAKQNSEFVTVVFVFDTNILDKLKAQDDRRITFIHQSLQELHSNLQTLGSGLVVLKGDSTVEIPSVAKILQADAVYTNLDVDPYSKKRDEKVFEKLSQMGCAFHLLKDHVIFSGLEVRKKNGTPFKKFTPYKNQWLKQLEPEHYRDATVEENNFTHHSKLKLLVRDWSLSDLGFNKNILWLEPGEEEAKKRLKRFLTYIQNYGTNRDYPAHPNSTSGLSVHLRFGTISVRACVRSALQANNDGARTWLNELIWRDFYHMTLDQFPHVIHSACKEKYNDIDWPGSDQMFDLWCKGMTGYPIVDAAMRYFNETGWMHNRLRMVVANFLCKDLMVDYKNGEKYFARYLLDFDLATNNGSWQWCASTGCDSQPYFRVFNPVVQSEKLDAKGEFIRQNCPELQNFSDEKIHAPWKASAKEQEKWQCKIGKDYPLPIVDHSTAKAKVVALFKKNRSKKFK